MPLTIKERQLAELISLFPLSLLGLKKRIKRRIELLKQENFEYQNGFGKIQLIFYLKHIIELLARAEFRILIKLIKEFKAASGS